MYCIYLLHKMFKIKLSLQQNALYKGQTATQFIC